MHTWVRVPKGPIPESVRQQFVERLQRHVARRWRGRVKKVFLKFGRAYVYVAALEGKPGGDGRPEVARYAKDDEIPVNLCRLGYLGSPDEWQYAFFKYSDERYEESVGRSGRFEVTPEEAFDTSAEVYLKPLPWLERAPRARRRRHR